MKPGGVCKHTESWYRIFRKACLHPGQSCSHSWMQFPQLSLQIFAKTRTSLGRQNVVHGHFFGRARSAALMIISLEHTSDDDHPHPSQPTYLYVLAGPAATHVNRSLAGWYLRSFGSGFRQFVSHANPQRLAETERGCAIAIVGTRPVS